MQLVWVDLGSSVNQFVQAGAIHLYTTNFLYKMLNDALRSLDRKKVMLRRVTETHVRVIRIRIS